MFTKDERRALLYLAVVAAAGGVLRVVRSPADAPGASIVAPDLPGEDLARQAELVREATILARPLRPGERMDMDRASAREIERLPRVGPALARRIVEDRDSAGPFGSLEHLDRVPGVGPSLLHAIERSVSFSGAPRAGAIPPATAPDGISRGAKSECAGSAPLALNRVTAAELECLPGIGPSLAARIVEDRTRRGPFREV
ncbi:MAG: helix-hairpin-helix domain-containing protein, partial [Gemmatimonadota bacterium]